MLHRIRPGRSISRDRRDGAILLEAVRAHERLIEIEFYTNQYLEVTHATLCSLNLSESAERALQIAEKLGDRWRRLECMGILGDTYAFWGDYVRSKEKYNEFHSEASRTGNLQFQAWSLVGKAFLELRCGVEAEAQVFLQAATEILGDDPDVSMAIVSEGLTAIIHQRRGDKTEALRAARGRLTSPPI